MTKEHLILLVSQSRLERLNLVMEEASFVMASFDDITAYLQRKGFLAP